MNITEKTEDILKARAIECNLDLETFKKLLYSKHLTEEEKERITKNYRFFGNYDSDSEEDQSDEQNITKNAAECDIKPKIEHIHENQICDFCDKSFRTEFSLNLHKKGAHPKGQPFKCDFVGCDKCFTRKGWLDKHKTAHMNNITIKCEERDENE